MLLVGTGTHAETLADSLGLGKRSVMFTGALVDTGAGRMHYSVELLPDRRYFDVSMRQKGDSHAGELGRGIWWLSADSQSVILEGGVARDEQGASYFGAVWRLQDARTLKLVDWMRGSESARIGGEIQVSENLVSLRDERLWDFQAALLETRWALRRLGKRRVAPQDPARESWFMLERVTQRLTGWVGCNRLTGHFDRGVTTLRLSALTITHMACRDDRRERSVMQALEQTWHYRVAGRELELFDEQGRSLAVFEEGNR
jgi:heat shock protein HslJ